jgi:hypothetical protein
MITTEESPRSRRKTLPRATLSTTQLRRTSRIRRYSAFRAGDQLPKALKPVVRLNMFQNYLTENISSPYNEPIASCLLK